MQNFSDLKKILDPVHDMVLVVDPASEEILVANQRACDVMEYSSEEMVQLKLKDIHPYDIPAITEFTEKVKRQKGTVTHELSCRTKSGKFLAAEVSGKTLKLNGDEYLIATVKEVPERKIEEKDLKLKQEKLEKLVQIRTRELEGYNHRLLKEIAQREKVEEHARNLAFFPEENPSPVFRISEEGRVLYANQACNTIFRRWETRVGKTLPEIFSGHISQAFKLQKPLEMETQVSDQFYSFVISKVKGKDYANIYAQNITERKRAGEALIHTKNEAEKANQAKSDFLAKMSHELRTPMNAMLGFSQILQMNSEQNLTPLQKENIDHILRAGNHLLDLINEILDLAKVESGNITLNPEPVNVVKLIEEMKDLLQPIANEYNIRLSMVLDPSMEIIARVDQLRLRQVLFNLVSNAIKYNRKGGQVTVACKSLNPENIQVDVIDTGIGIAIEDQDKLFEPFNRLGREHSDSNGTGIGLTVTRELVKLMGGSLGLTSQPNEGSHFYIELPVAGKP